MTLVEQAARRIELAHTVGVQPRRWVASSAAAAALPVADGVLLGIPLVVGQPRSDWGLDLVLAPR